MSGFPGSSNQLKLCVTSLGFVCIHWKSISISTYLQYHLIKYNPNGVFNTRKKTKKKNMKIDEL